MGGIGISLSIKRLDETSCEPHELHVAIWDRVSKFIGNTCRRAACHQVLGSYLSNEADDGFANDRWTSSDNELSFSFMDAAGCCNMSMYASLHWVELAIAFELPNLKELGSSLGYEITEKRT